MTNILISKKIVKQLKFIVPFVVIIVILVFFVFRNAIQEQGDFMTDNISPVEEDRKTITQDEEITGTVTRKVSNFYDLFRQVSFKDYSNQFRLSSLSENNSFRSKKVLTVSCIEGFKELYTIEKWATERGNKEQRDRINKLNNELRDGLEFHQICYQNNYYFLVYTDNEKHFDYSFGLINKVYAGSGKLPVSIAVVTPEDKIVLIDNIETAITKDFDELSFYFNCRRLVAMTSGGELVVSCNGSGGKEDTAGLILVNIDNVSKEYLSYCIDVYENPGPPSPDNTDGIYTCYEKNKKVYYVGSLD